MLTSETFFLSVKNLLHLTLHMVHSRTSLFIQEKCIIENKTNDKDL